MGGERETEVSQKPSKKALADGAVLLAKLRVHESGGEAHFHDDKRNLKAAVPIGLWWSAWEQLSTCQLASWRYLDAANGTLLTIDMERSKNEDGTPHFARVASPVSDGQR